MDEMAMTDEKEAEHLKLDSNGQVTFEGSLAVEPESDEIEIMIRDNAEDKEENQVEVKTIDNPAGLDKDELEELRTG